MLIQHNTRRQVTILDTLYFLLLPFYQNTAGHYREHLFSLINAGRFLPWVAM